MSVIVGCSDIYGWPESQCRYPSWLVAKSSWRSLDDTVKYTIAKDGDVIVRRSHGNAVAAPQLRNYVTSFRCLKSTDYEAVNGSVDVTGHVTYIVAHVLDGW